MTAQTRYGRATVEAAHKLDQEPGPDTLTDALKIIVAGVVGIVVVLAICLAAAQGGVNVLNAIGGWLR